VICCQIIYLLIDCGNITGVIDFGCLGIGDISCDLIILWWYFDASHRKYIINNCFAVNDEVMKSARSWALWKWLSNMRNLDKIDNHISMINKILLNSIVDY